MREAELLARAEAGKALSKDDRLRLLWYLETSTDMARAEMAQLLRCSDRHVYRLLIRVREQMATEVRREELLGRLAAGYERAKAGLLQEIRALPPGKRWRAWKGLWDIETGYVSLAASLTLEARVKDLEEAIARVHANGNAQKTP